MYGVPDSVLVLVSMEVYCHWLTWAWRCVVLVLFDMHIKAGLEGRGQSLSAPDMVS